MRSSSVIRILERLDILHLVTGSVASSFHGRLRLTHDADIVIDPSLDHIEALVGPALRPQPGTSRYNRAVTSDTSEAHGARRTWPVRVYRLGEEPGDDQSRLNTATERLAMMWDLARDAWSLSGRPLPDYPRSETPVSCRPWRGAEDVGP